MNENHDLLIRYLDGELDPSERDRIEQQLGLEPRLRADLQRLESLRRLVSESRADSFAPYFSDRVMRRLIPAAATESADSLYLSLRWVFVRAVAACLVLAVALGTVNVLDYHALESTSTLIDAMFGLPSESLWDALTYLGS